MLKEGSPKIAALEEFLHGTQKRIGLLDKEGFEIAEIRVKDFMVRHAHLLGLSENDKRVLNRLKEVEIEHALKRGYSRQQLQVKSHE